MDSEPITIHIDDDVDRWRFVCPRGHRNWEPVDGHFWCQSCARLSDPGVDPTFTELKDEKTERLLRRDEIVLMTPVGPYSEVRKEGSP